MKRLVLSASIMFLLAAGSAASAQVSEVREFVDPASFSSIAVRGKSNVVYLYDTVCYVSVSWAEGTPRPQSYGLKVANGELVINDTTGTLAYSVHLDTALVFPTWSVSSSANVTFPDGHVVSVGESSFRSIGNEFKSLIDELVDVFDSITLDKKPSNSPKVSATTSTRKFSVRDRTNFDFHWGFNNWGDSWYNGLMKMDGPYNLRTSFSSYQLSENYAIVMTDHFKFSVGIGYESDIYKFTDNYVHMDATGALVTQDQAGVDAVSGVSGTSLGDWSTRLVTRYVTMPIEIEYRDRTVLKSFRLALGIVPGLSFSSSHTGLKHELEKSGRNYQEVQDGVSKFINPYKLDVRLTFKRKAFGVFIQLPTQPVFIDTDTKVYPIKVGFML